MEKLRLEYASPPLMEVGMVARVRDDDERSARFPLSPTDCGPLLPK